MIKDEAVIIERTANGYIIRPVALPGMTTYKKDLMVFQVKGYSSGPGEGIKTDDTLLGFIAEHFSEGMLDKSE